MLSFLRRLFGPLAYKMPDSVRSLPVPSIRNMIAAGSLTVCKPL